MTALWYLTRGAGAVTLLLLTTSVVLGIVHTGRRRPAGTPRMLVDAAHRTISLLAMALLVVHVATSVIDGYAPIRLVDAVVPFVSAYRPLWLGLGALALDLLVAVAATSLLRARIGRRAWRTVHWLAYACWPVAVVHALGTGSDARAAWLLALTAACVVAVLVAVGARIAAAGPGHALPRAGALAALGAGTFALAAWLPAGPLAQGWARRAGTPAALLGKPAAATVRAPRGFSSPLRGHIRQGLVGDGRAVVDIALRVRAPRDRLRLRLAGVPLDGGGLSLTSSAVTLSGGGRVWQGRVQRLRGTDIAALVGDGGGRALRLQVHLRLTGPSATGRLVARPVTSGATA